MTYRVVVSESARAFLGSLDKKSKSICKKNLRKLISPYPGRGSGDKERLVIAGKDRYRMHIGRSYTALYIIDEEKKLVRVVEILTIKAAHKKYGF
ncbi:type II toxin-antitoxin system RelE/ParE family toxin [Candidatus Woesearchaeota archaeon]|nr:type II toxin-antitoxin system RelE/ParE family toxin [Candidatus Woesearchaeota archaeon]